MPEDFPQIEENIQTIQETLQELLVDAIRALPGLIAALVIFIITLYIAGLTSRAARRAMDRRQASAHAKKIVTNIAYWSVLALGTIAALQQVGFNLTAFLTGLGIAGFTIGFALQDVSKNFISGLLLLIQQPFTIGEAIEVTGFGGTVIAIDLRATELHTFDGRVVFIPNADIFTNPITNFTRASRRRLELNGRVSYASDLEVVRQTALQAIRSVPGLLEVPAPLMNFHTFGSSTIDFTLYFWIDTGQVDMFIAKDRALLALKSAFDTAGIDVPYPVQTLHLKQEA